MTSKLSAQENMFPSWLPLKEGWLKEIIKNSNKKVVNVLRNYKEEFEILDIIQICENVNCLDFVISEYLENSSVSVTVKIFKAQLLKALCKNKNPEISKVLSKYLPEIDSFWISYFSENVNAVSLLEGFNNYESLDKKTWINLCKNENAINIIKKNLLYIKKIPFNEGWISLCSNKKAVDILKENVNYFDESCIVELCLNEDMIEIVEKCIGRLIGDGYWKRLCRNSGAMEFIYRNWNRCEKYIEDICLNPNSNILDRYIKDKKITKQMWYNLCKNENAASIILSRVNDLPIECFDILCQNKNCVNLAIANKDKLTKVGWEKLCEFPDKKILDFIGENINKVSLEGLKKLYKNPCILEYSN